MILYLLNSEIATKIAAAAATDQVRPRTIASGAEPRPRFLTVQISREERSSRAEVELSDRDSSWRHGQNQSTSQKRLKNQRAEVSLMRRSSKVTKISSNSVHEFEICSQKWVIYNKTKNSQHQATHSARQRPLTRRPRRRRSSRSWRPRRWMTNRLRVVVPLHRRNLLRRFVFFAWNYFCVLVQELFMEQLKLVCKALT